MRAGRGGICWLGKKRSTKSSGLMADGGGDVEAAAPPTAASRSSWPPNGRRLRPTAQGYRGRTHPAVVDLSVRRQVLLRRRRCCPLPTMLPPLPTPSPTPSGAVACHATSTSSSEPNTLEARGVVVCGTSAAVAIFANSSPSHRSRIRLLQPCAVIGGNRSSSDKRWIHLPRAQIPAVGAGSVSPTPIRFPLAQIQRDFSSILEDENLVLPLFLSV